MNQFKLRHDSFNEIRKTILVRSIPIMLLAITAGFYMSTYSTNSKHNNFDILPIMIPFVLVLVGVSLWFSLKRQKVLFDSYRLTIDDTSITREQYNTPVISISKEDIQEIIKGKNGAFAIKGKSSLDVIGIPAQIEDYETLEKLLAETRYISPIARTSLLQKFSFLYPIIVIVLMVSIYVSDNKIIVGVCGALFIGTMTYSFFEIRRSKNIENRLKKGQWLSILVLIQFLAVILFKLFWK
ncbi:MAG: hypothetical protein U0264_11190 [Candidatus Kapaibacterium sp.]